MRFLFRTRKNYLIGRAYQEIATSVVGTYYSLTFCNIAADTLYHPKAQNGYATLCF